MGAAAVRSPYDLVVATKEVMNGPRPLDWSVYSHDCSMKRLYQYVITSPAIPASNLAQIQHLNINKNPADTSGLGDRLGRRLPVIVENLFTPVVVMLPCLGNFTLNPWKWPMATSAVSRTRSR